MMTPVCSSHSAIRKPCTCTDRHFHVLSTTQSEHDSAHACPEHSGNLRRLFPMGKRSLPICDVPIASRYATGQCTGVLTSPRGSSPSAVAVCRGWKAPIASSVSRPPSMDRWLMLALPMMMYCTPH